MFQIDGLDTVPAIPLPSAPGPNPNSFFRKADVATSTRGTVVTTDWLNAVQMEICNVITTAGIVLNKAVQNQLVAALQAWVQIAGLISHLTDTGAVSTTHTRVVVGSTNSRAMNVTTGVLASADSTAGGLHSAVVAGDTNVISDGAGVCRLVAASVNCTVGAATDHACIVASSLCTTTPPQNAFVAAAELSDVGGNYSACIGTVATSQATGTCSIVIGGSDIEVSGDYSLIGAAFRALVDGDESVILASEGAAAGGADCQTGGTCTAIIGCFGTGAAPVTIAAGAQFCAIVGCTDTTLPAAASYAIVLGSDDATAAGTYALVAASALGCDASGAAAATIASGASDSSGAYASVIASSSSDADGTNSAIVACGSVDIGGGSSSNAIIASDGQTVGGTDVQLLGSRGAVIASYGAAADIIQFANTCDMTAIIASSSCSMTGTTRGATVASQTSDIDNADHAAVVACDDVRISSSGDAHAIMASMTDGAASPLISGSAHTSAIVACYGDIDVSGDSDFVAACQTGAGTGPNITGDKSGALCSDGQFQVSMANSLVACSSWGAAGINLNAALDANSLIMGDAAGGGVGASLRTLRLEGAAGNGVCDGAWAGGGVDYAEYFANAEEGELPVGSILSQSEGLAALATKGDRVLGIVSAKPAFVAGGADLHWHGGRQVDEWGREVKESIPWVSWRGYDGPVEGAPSSPVSAETYVDRRGSPNHRIVEVPCVRWRSYDGLIDESLDPPKGAEYYTHETVIGEDTLSALCVRWTGYDGPVEEAPHVPDWATYYTRRMARQDERVREHHYIKWAGYDGPLDGAPAREDWPEDAQESVRDSWVPNPDWAPDQEYVRRSDRPAEWTCVGLLGQLRVRVDGTVRPGSYVVPLAGGVGTHADLPGPGRPVECMRVLHEPTSERGCGIALCLVG